MNGDTINATTTIQAPLAETLTQDAHAANGEALASKLESAKAAAVSFEHKTAVEIHDIIDGIKSKFHLLSRAELFAELDKIRARL